MDLSQPPDPKTKRVLIGCAVVMVLGLAICCGVPNLLSDDYSKVRLKLNRAKTDLRGLVQGTATSAGSDPFAPASPYRIGTFDGVRVGISRGPDGHFGTPDDATFEQLPNYQYDPTNGLESEGDILIDRDGRLRAPAIH